MTRETVDFGIDLGTTNSAIAVSAGSDGTVVRNNLEMEYTPSAVYISKSGNVYVGKSARDRVEADPLNAHSEFKLQMGMRDKPRMFADSGRALAPEQLSAEVLKSLRADVQKKLGEAITAAVITVPAAFELDQCDATRRAATLAGLDFAPLVQEPTAAAWAYSAQASNVPSKCFWLVYDFGGGTFDAAVVQVQDGEFTVVNHAGDNFLGGKLIDWTIVDELLVPAVAADGSLPAFDRSHPRWRSNVAKLKVAAENAKIELSHSDFAEIAVEIADEDDRRFSFTYEMTRADVERLSLPLYRRSVELCRRALSERGLKAADIERVILVGGATMAPALRALLADPVDGLGIPLDHSLDPVTVVARGAAIFARTQRIPRDLTRRAVVSGHVRLDFQNQPTGRGSDPLVGGKAVEPVRDDWTGHTIEFVNNTHQPIWRSGQVPLTKAGTFTTRLLAAAQSNKFDIEFRTPAGTLVPTEPASTSYQRMNMEGGDSTLSHSVGVWLEGNEVKWILRKGAELPAVKRIVLESTVDVRRGAAAGLIRVPIVEGERPRADRNTVIGQLDIRPDQITRDVPAGSEIEVSITIDRSFTPHVDAFVPILDEEFDIEVELGRTGAPGVKELRRQCRALETQHDKLHAAGANPFLQEVQDLLVKIRHTLDSAEHNPDAPAAAQALIRTAESLLDKAEEAAELPQLLAEASQMRQWVADLNAEAGDQRSKQEAVEAQRKLDEAATAGDITVVTHQIEVLRKIGVDVLESTGELPAIRFNALKQHFSGSRDPRIQALIADGDKALVQGDNNRLTMIANELGRLVPPDRPVPDDSAPSTVRSRR
ncbi:molecular chaperone DnaK [Kibdelosporangium banguiense]|uniref:Molecular chaperone DnaK n=1 Tax=Kibdelosporangium banguiense TaxID=1365924 RepID=A0ABS4TJ20_9PSEU|nr:Hsp70 family protein [Kibdelosporangium banguiense]MBP2324412.1 molecular chaperone DnaK [Kibdelosporangium banguiense]